MNIRVFGGMYIILLVSVVFSFLVMVHRCTPGILTVLLFVAWLGTAMVETGKASTETSERRGQDYSLALVIALTIVAAYHCLTLALHAQYFAVIMVVIVAYLMFMWCGWRTR